MNEMMKRTVILTLLLSAMLFSGCYMFRRLAGRPTAEELDRSLIRLQEKIREIPALQAA